MFSQPLTRTQPSRSTQNGSFGLPPFIVDHVEGLALGGTTAEIDLEAIAALEPDLNLSSTLRHTDFHDVLSEIAPTVFSERSSVTFKQNSALYTAAFGSEAEAAQIVTKYETKVRESLAGRGRTTCQHYRIAYM